MNDRIRPVVLSGGAGTRLWPLSTPEMPKQFLALTGEQTLLALTLERVADSGRYEPPMIVGSAAHKELIQIHAAKAGVADAMLVLEPFARNTAPAIAIAALLSPVEQPLLVMPSDHVIQDTGAFLRAVDAALPLVVQGYLLTLGIVPDKPETGFGYIRRGQAISADAFQALSFVEKPNLEAAARYCAAGDYAWNAGIFLFRAGDYLAALAEHAPDILQACRRSVETGIKDGSCFIPDEAEFRRSPSISVDYAVMEKAARIGIIPVEMGWSDIGSWDALYELLARGPGSNVADANTIILDCGGSLVKSNGPRIAAIGVEDLIIIATADSVLVIPRGQSQRVKEVGGG